MLCPFSWRDLWSASNRGALCYVSWGSQGSSPALFHVAAGFMEKRRQLQLMLCGAVAGVCSTWGVVESSSLNPLVSESWCWSKPPLPFPWEGKDMLVQGKETGSKTRSESNRAANHVVSHALPSIPTLVAQHQNKSVLLNDGLGDRAEQGWVCM